jgi:protein phosphatase
MTLVGKGRWDDVTLLCTEALTKRVTDEEIREHQVHIQTSGQTCHALVACALERGGEDNVTVVIGRLRRRPG